MPTFPLVIGIERYRQSAGLLINRSTVTFPLKLAGCGNAAICPPTFTAVDFTVNTPVLLGPSASKTPTEDEASVNTPFKSALPTTDTVPAVLLTLMLLKEVVPEIDWFPALLKVTVPLFESKVLLLVK